MCCHVVTNTGSSEANIGISPTDLTFYEPVLLIVHCTCAQSYLVKCCVFPSNDIFTLELKSTCQLSGNKRFKIPYFQTVKEYNRNYKFIIIFSGL